MPKINMARAIRLNLDNGQFIDLTEGENKVDKDIADHWYVKANLVGAENAAPAPGSFEYAQSQRAAMAEILAQQEADAAKAAVEAEEQRKANEAALMQKTAEAIAAGAQQAQDAATKDDPNAAPAVQDIPNPLSVTPPASEGADGASEGGAEAPANDGSGEANAGASA